jgi:hypothetical protein
MMGVEGGADIKVHAIRDAYHGGPDGAHLMREAISMQSEWLSRRQAPMELT